jgi:hypothetical protein
MRTVLALIAAAGVASFLASWVMWWATKRSALWSMVTAVLLFFLLSAAGLLIVWLLTRPASP